MGFLDWPDYHERWDSVPMGRYLVGNNRKKKKKKTNSEITVCSRWGCGREMQTLSKNVRAREIIRASPEADKGLVSEGMWEQNQNKRF